MRLWKPLDAVGAGGETEDAGPNALAGRFVNLIPEGVTGRVAQVGQEIRYTFTLDSERQVYLDSLTNRSDIRFSLTGPQGVVVSERRLDQADAVGIGSNGNPVLALPAGEYTLLVTGQGAATGNFNFVLRDLADAEVLVKGVPLQGALEPGNVTRMYRFEASAGDRIFLDNIATSSNISWRLIDPFGAVELGRLNPGDRTNERLARSGTYTFLIEGNIGAGGLGGYHLAVYDIAAPEPIALEAGALMAADIDVPGRVRAFSFDLDAPAQMVMDVFNNLSAVRWTLVGPDGVEVNARQFNQTDGMQQSGETVLRLGPGAHELRVFAVDDTTGSFSFRLRDIVAEAVALPLNNERTANLSDAGRGMAVLAITLEENQAVALTVPSGGRPGGNTAWRLISPDGYQLRHGRMPVNASELFVAPVAGTYHVLIEGDTRDATTDTPYRVNFVTSLVGAAPGAVLEDFQGGDGIAHVLQNNNGVPAGVVDTGGGDFALRLLSNDQPNQRNGVAFSSTLTGRQESVSVGFDFRIEAPGAGLPGEGLVLGWFPAAQHGQGGAVPWLPVPPNTAGVLAVNLQVFRASGGPAMTLHWGSQRAEVPLSGLGLTELDLVDVPGALGLEMTRVAGGTNVTVTLTLDGTARVLVEDHFIPGFELAEGRAAIQARNGAANLMGLTVDNLSVVGVAASSAPVAGFDTELSGAITEPGAVDRWLITLDEAKQFVADSRTNNSNLRWTITGAAGSEAVAVAERRFDNTDASGRSGNTVLELPAGTYFLNVYGAGNAVGSYNLWLFDVENATPLAADAVLETTIDPGTSMQLYRLDWPGSVSGDADLYLETRNVSGPQAEWRLIGPNGALVQDRTTFNTDITRRPLAQPGPYLLIVEGRIGNTDPTAVWLQARQAATTQVAMALDSTVTGTLAAAGDRVVHSFTLDATTRLYFDSLTNRSDLSWQLEGPSGTLGSTLLQRADSTWVTNDSAVMRAVPGEYRLTISGTGAATGDFGFILHDLDAAAAVDFGDVVEAAYDPANSSRAFRFDGVAGQELFVDYLSGTLSGRWKVVDGFGNLLESASATTNMQSVRLISTGPHWLLVEGAINQTGESAHSFRILPLESTLTELDLGERVATAISLPGQTDRYSFTVTEESWVYVDVQGPRASQWFWDLTGPRGLEASRRFDQSDSSDNTGSAPLFRLIPGEYVFTIRPTAGAVGEYSFQILDAGAAVAITPGTPVSGQLAPGTATRLYSFEAEAGERFFFDRTEGNFREYWRLIDPYGQQIFATSMANDVETLTLPETGRYLVLVEGNMFYPETRSFAFNVYANPVRAPIRLAGLEYVPGPDLVPLDLRLDTDDEIFSGGQVPVAWTIANEGERAVEASFTNRVTIRRADNGQILANVLVPYDHAVRGDIAPGESVAQSVVLTLPAGTAAVGDLVIQLALDVNNDIDESNLTLDAETNNSAELPITSGLAPYVDLVPEGVTVEPSEAGWTAGEMVTVSWTTRNDGTVASDGAWSERLVVRNLSTNRVVLSQDIRIAADQGLGAGESALRELSFGWPAGVDGTGLYDFQVVVDALAEVFETNPEGTGETNNTLTLRRASAPDLVVRAVTVDEAEPASGQPITIRWVVANEGAAATPEAWLDRVRVTRVSGGQVLHNVAVAVEGSIGPGGELERSVTLVLPHGASGVGNIRVEVWADANASGTGAINEARDGLTVAQAENNNYAVMTFTSVARPYADLVASIVGVPDAPRGGETGTITWRVVNAGEVVTDAEAWVDRVWLSTDATLDPANDILLKEVVRTGALDDGAAYEVSADILLPTGVEGNVWLFVETDALEAVTEPDTRADNRAGQQVSLSSPFSDLAVQTVGAPSGAYLGGDTVEVSWRVANLGPDPMPAPPGGIVDRVWLAAGEVPSAGDILIGEFARAGGLAVGASYSRVETIELPLGVAGTYRVMVTTNADGAVFERGETGNNFARSGADLTLSPAPAADLAVTLVEAPDDLVPGEQVELRFVVQNIGQAVARAPWTDRILIRGPGLSANGTQLASIDRAFDLAPGDSYEVTRLVTVPVNLGQGDFRFAVQTDQQNRVFEAGRLDNNIAESTPATLRHPNLTVPEVTLPEGPFQSGDSIAVGWTVANVGTGATASGWTDRIWLSRTPEIAADAILLAERESDAEGPFAAGASVSALVDVTIPVFASGEWYIVVQADALNQVAEPGAEDDNTAAAALTVALSPFANLVVTEVTAPALTVADPARIEISWTVANEGTGRGLTDTWVDRVWLERMPGPSGPALLELARVEHSGGLDQGESYTRTQSVLLPPDFNGRFRLFVTTDADGVVFENNLEADNTLRLDGFVDVMPIPYADLEVASVTAPAVAESGVPIKLGWTVVNNGIGQTSTSSWNDRVFVADNPEGVGRVSLGTFNRIGFLSPGGSYDREVTVTLPQGWTGPTWFFVETPGDNRVRTGVGAPFEFVYTDAGNTGRSDQVDVSLSPPPDLIVTEVLIPATAPEGTPIDVTWTVRNDGIGPAEGQWVDRLVLRPIGENAPGARDVTLATQNFTGPLQAGTSYTRTAQVILPKQITGNYRVVVITDATDQVFEHSGEDNNETASLTQLAVTVQPRPDLQVFDIIAPDRLEAGATGALRFEIINQGPVATDVPNWTDRVYLSLTPTITSASTLLASLSNEAALAPGERYLSQEVVFKIPERFRDTVYLLVATDATNRVEEWPNEGNNLRVHELFVEGIPLADLVVHDVVTPFQTFEGSDVTVTYSVTNRGAGPTNTGSWTEQVWLTTDRTRPHPSKGDVLLTTLQYTDGVLEVGAGYDRTVTVTLPSTLVSGNYFITPWVDPFDQVLEDTLAVNVNPDDPAGLNSNNYKAGGADAIGRPNVLQIIGNPPPVVNPEVMVEILSVTERATSGLAGEDEFEVTYRLTNYGTGPTTGYSYQLDISNVPIRTAPGAQNWSISAGFGPRLGAGESVTLTESLRLPAPVQGNYVLLSVNVPGDTDPTDNTAFALTDVTPAIPNLVVTEVVPPESAFSGEEILIRYTVTNEGDVPVWDLTRFWRDEVWVSPDPVFIRDRATLLSVETIANDTPLAAGASYSRELEATLPPGIDGDFYVYVFTNVANAGTLNAPRTEAQRGWFNTSSGPIRGQVGSQERLAFESPVGSELRADLPVTYREPNLVVSELVVPEELTAGQTVEISFTVTNIGNRATREDAWYDRVYLSLDATLDEGDFLLRREEAGREIRAEHRREGVLEPGESYTATVTVTLPFEVDGEFHILAVADSGLADSNLARSTISTRLPGVRGNPGGAVREFQGEGDNTTAQAVTVLPATAPNLVVSDLVVPERITRGQPFEVSWTVTNLGGPVPFQQSTWDDLVFFSRDQHLDLRADRFVTQQRHTGGLGAGESYTVTRTLIAPADLPTDAYYMFVVTDPARYGPRGDVFEGANEDDNATRTALPVIFEMPPPTDLVVSNIRVPDNVRAGDEITIRWTVTNESEDVPAEGQWSDSVFLSTDGTWDITDRPMGRVQTSGPLLPGESREMELTTVMPAAAPGQYRVIVRTDIFNQIREDNEANNTAASADTLSVAVDEMIFDTPVTVHLGEGQERLWRITVPPGETMRVTLRSSDPRQSNEIFIRHDALPTPNAFDATYRGPVSPDLTALVPGTQPGTYYISVRNFSGPSAGADITLIAELLPLQVTDVRSDRGGDSRFVTTVIEGAQFAPGATVRLVRPGIDEFAPVNWQVVDSTRIIAIFDLTGAERGLYDVVVTNPSGEQAVLPYRFLVERAIEGDVTIGIGGPRLILAGEGELYSVAFQNLNNLDAPYTHFQLGTPELHLNPYVYGLPFLEFFTNVAGTPDGAAGTPNEDIFWAGLDSLLNIGGQNTVSGFVYDVPVDGFSGFTFNIATYPGLKELHDEAFGAFRDRMARVLPELDEFLEGGEGGIEAWFEALVEKATDINPQLGAVLRDFPFMELYNQNAAKPGEDEIPFIPFRFHIFAAATSMSRDEFVAFQTAEALALREKVLQDLEAPPALVAIAGDPDSWVGLYLAGLEQAGILRDEDAVPPVRLDPKIMSLMSVLASGILFGPAGAEIRSTASVLEFFEQVREWYGHDPDQMADIEFWEERRSPRVVGEIPVPRLPVFEDYDLGLTNRTHWEAVRIFVPWVPFDSRGAALPEDFMMGPASVDAEAFVSLDFSDYFADPANAGRLASLIGPQTFDTEGWLPATERLPYTIRFENDGQSDSWANRVEIVTRLDPDLDPRSFELGDIRIGDISIRVPAGRWFYEDTIDFRDTLGFMVRVSAGVDLFQDPAAVRWVVQAIDPLTGEELQSTTRGLLPPNSGGLNGAGFVSYTVRPKADVPTGAQITASARVLFDNLIPEETLELRQVVDGSAPTTTLSVNRIAGTDDFELRWTSRDDAGGSGVRHVTLYVAEDGGDFRIFERRIEEAAGTRIFEGVAGKSYEFLAIATDIAGNVERPRDGSAVGSDGQPVNLGAPATVEASTPPNFGQPPAPVETPSPNPIFDLAEQRVPAADPLTRLSEFEQVLSPFVGSAFATGIGASQGGIAPMAIVELEDGRILVSGGANRGEIHVFTRDGGEASATTLLAAHDLPIFQMLQDGEGRLWATTGGGALVQLDPETGAILARHGEGITLGLAWEEATGLLYVGTGGGISTFDPVSGTFAQWSRDENLRVGSLAFDDYGDLWAVTWPDRAQVVRFTERQRAEAMFTFQSQVDSIAFGRAGTVLEDLMFVTANTGAIGRTGEYADGSALTMIDLATLRRIDIAQGGTRGDAVIATSDGRVLLSQSGQVDLIAPAYAPSVRATNPPADAVVPLPMPVLTVQFDQDMFFGSPGSAASVLTPENFVLEGATVGRITPTGIAYDIESRTVLLKLSNLQPDDYTLTVRQSVTSQNGLRMVEDHVTSFRGVSDLSTILDIEFTGTRFDRASGTVRYEVAITNLSDGEIVLPAMLTIGAASGFPGLPQDAVVGEDGLWMIDLAASLPADGRLAPGASTTGQTIAIVTPDRQRLVYTTGVVGTQSANRAPVFVSTPPEVAVLGEVLEFSVAAEDPDQGAVFYHLLSGPEGMEVDPVTGAVSWTPAEGVRESVPVVLQAFDARGAVSVQSFVLTVEGGNRAPVFVGLPAEVLVDEGGLVELQVIGQDADGDALAIWVDGLPGGAVWDAQTRVLTWRPDYDQAGTYTVSFRMSDGVEVVSSEVVIRVAEAMRPARLIAPASLTIREGERIRVDLIAEAEPGAPLNFGAFNNSLPWGAQLNAATGSFDWTPTYIQAGTYEVLFGVSDGSGVAMARTVIEVLPANGAPVFDDFSGMRVFESQELALRVFAFDPDNPFYVPPVRLADDSLVDAEEAPRTVSVEVVGDLPEGAVFDAESWLLTWRPGAGMAGTHEIRFRATDDGAGTGVPAVTEEVVSIEVLPYNQAPVVAPVDTISMARDTVREVAVSAFDPDGDPLTLILRNESPGMPLPDFISFTDNGDGTGLIRLEPGVGDRGNYALMLIAHDDGGSQEIPRGDAYTFVVEVEADNEPPQWRFQNDVVAVMGQPLVLELQASDLDQDALTFGLEGLPPGAVLTADPLIYGRAQLTWIPTLADVGSFTATVSATDTGAGGLAAPETTDLVFDITVRPVNAAPVLDPIGVVQATVEERIQRVFGATDPDGDALTYSATGLPAGARFDRETGALDWTPTALQAGSFTFTIAVSDGAATSTETVTVEVAAVNRAPVFVPMFTQLGRERNEISFTVVANDPDGDPVVLSAVSGMPEGAGFSPARGEFVWIPQYGQAGEHVIRFAAQDPSGAVDFLDVTVSVAKLNRAPVLEASDRAFLIGEERSFVVEAFDPDGDPITLTALDLPEGAVLDGATGEVTWTPGPGQAGDYYVTFIASDGVATGRQTILMRATLEPVAPSVRIELTPSFPARPGQEVLIQVVADSLADITGVQVFADGQALALDGFNRARITPTSPGKIELRAVAVDADGQVGETVLPLKVRDPEDRLAPVLGLAQGPLAGQLSGVVTVSGLVADANLDFWRLELRDVSGNRLIEVLAEGETTLDGALGTLDTRGLLNGFYQLRLVARDIGGRESRTQLRIEVNGADKSARHVEARVDLSVSLGGVPFDLERRHDSLVPGPSDFGSFSAGFDAQLALGVAGFDPARGVWPPMVAGERLYMTAPDGTRLGFTFAPEPETVAGVTFFRPGWVADQEGWSLATGDTLLRLSGGRFYTVADGAPYNVTDPSLGGARPFVLTAPEGTALTYGADGRLREIASAEGRLFVGDGGGWLGAVLHPRCRGADRAGHRAGRADDALHLRRRGPAVGGASSAGGHRGALWP